MATAGMHICICYASLLTAHRPCFEKYVELKYLKQQHLIDVRQGECVMIACSGGLRSTVLRHLVDMVGCAFHEAAGLIVSQEAGAGTHSILPCRCATH